MQVHLTELSSTSKPYTELPPLYCLADENIHRISIGGSHAEEKISTYPQLPIFIHPLSRFVMCILHAVA